MGRKLTKTTLVEGVVYDAGTDEADIDGADTVTADVWDQESSEDGNGGDYSDFKAADLKAEIERRNEGRGEDDLIPTTGNKAELIAALVADDEAQD